MVCSVKPHTVFMILKVLRASHYGQEEQEEQGTKMPQPYHRIPHFYSFVIMSLRTISGSNRQCLHQGTQQGVLF